MKSFILSILDFFLVSSQCYAATLGNINGEGEVGLQEALFDSSFIEGFSLHM
jgi:hypothetical protein